MEGGILSVPLFSNPESSASDQREIVDDDKGESLMRIARTRPAWYGTVLFCLLLLPAALQAQADEEAWQRHMEAASAALQADNPDDANFALGNALREAEEFGPGDQRLASTLGLMASFQRSQGNFDYAESLGLRLVAALEQGLGEDDPSVANALDTLASLYQEMYELRSAQEARQEDHAHQDDQAHEHDPSLDSAENVLLRALAIREKAFGQDHPSVDRSVNRLVVIYDAQGNYDEARQLLERSLQTRQRVLGEDAPEVAAALYNMGILAQKQEDLAEAETLLLRSGELRERRFGPQDLELARSLNALASLYTEQRRYEEAEQLLQRSLSIHEGNLGEDHPGLVPVLGSLSTLHAVQDRPVEVQQLLERSLSLEERAFGEEHIFLVSTLNNLALAHMAQEHYGEAAQIWERVLAIQKAANGPNDPSLIETLGALGEAHRMNGNTRDSIRFLRDQEAVIESSGRHEH